MFLTSNIGWVNSGSHEMSEEQAGHEEVEMRDRNEVDGNNLTAVAVVWNPLHRVWDVVDVIWNPLHGAGRVLVLDIQNLLRHWTS